MIEPQKIYQAAKRLADAKQGAEFYKSALLLADLRTHERILHLIISVDISNQPCPRQLIRHIFGISKKQEAGYTGSLIGLGLIKFDTFRGNAFFYQPGFRYIGPKR